MKREHAEMIIEAFRSHETNNDYFGLDTQDTLRMGEVIEAIIDEWPDLSDSSTTEWLRCAKIAKFGKPLSDAEASKLRLTLQL